MASREIRSFERDEDGLWVARLECGHPQHVRHDPPWQRRPWVLSEEGRRSHLGAVLDCPYCDMPALPADVSVYKCTPTFTEATIPPGLLRQHRTKASVWGRIQVATGRLRYELGQASWILRPGIPGIIPPQVEHCVAVVGEVAFKVEFLRRPAGDSAE